MTKTKNLHKPANVTHIISTQAAKYTNYSENEIKFMSFTLSSLFKFFSRFVVTFFLKLDLQIRDNEAWKTTSLVLI